jgi:hypothetical protein
MKLIKKWVHNFLLFLHGELYQAYEIFHTKKNLSELSDTKEKSLVNWVRKETYELDIDSCSKPPLIMLSIHNS